MDDGMYHWLVSEFKHVDFGDSRIEDRFFATAIALSSRPMDDILQACGNIAAAKGAYRLFSNDKFDESELLASHQIEAAQRLQGHKVVFSLQDTTFLDFDTHVKTKGLGSISKGYGIKDKLGLILHPSLIVTRTGLPLGCLSLDCWSRPIRERRSRQEKNRLQYSQSIEEKESNKWIEGWQNSFESIPAGCRVITVADREADIFELMAKIDLATHGFVIRSRINRRLSEKRNYWKRKKKVLPPKLWDKLALQAPQGLSEIEIPATGERSARRAKIEIRFCEETIFMSEGLYYGVEKKRQYKMPRKLLLHAINIKEYDTNSDNEPIDWTLLTSEPVSSIEEALEIVEWYKLRWIIECFFRILKSGCRLESCRLAEAKRLKKYTTLMAVIAYRILLMEKMVRETPEESAQAILTRTEWQALYCRVKKSRSLPDSPPTIKEVVFWIAQLGGFAARKRDGYPGHMVLWRGLQRLSDTVETWLAVRSTAPP